MEHNHKGKLHLVQKSMSSKGKVYAIGDVHGCREELERLLKKLELTAEDQLYFLGDLINRGPDSAGVLRLVQSLPNTRCILGNHELRLLKYRRNSNPTYLKPYDWETIHQLNDDDWNFMASFDRAIELPEHKALLVHGGLAPWLPWQEHSIEMLTEIQTVNASTKEAGKRSQVSRGRSWQDLWEGPPFVLCGHTPRKEIYRAKSSLCIDTGCVYGGRLTACDIATQKIIQVKALDDYVVKSF